MSCSSTDVRPAAEAQERISLADKWVDPAWKVSDERLNEMSGLAFSGRQSGRVWTHNDSGGQAVIYALDTADGRVTGVCRLDGQNPGGLGRHRKLHIVWQAETVDRRLWR